MRSIGAQTPGKVYMPKGLYIPTEGAMNKSAGIAVPSPCMRKSYGYSAASSGIGRRIIQLGINVFVALAKAGAIRQQFNRGVRQCE